MNTILHCMYLAQQISVLKGTPPPQILFLWTLFQGIISCLVHVLRGFTLTFCICVYTVQLFFNFLCPCGCWRT